MKPEELAPQQVQQPEPAVEQAVTPEEAEAIRKEMFMSSGGVKIGQTMEQYRAEREQLWEAKKQRELQSSSDESKINEASRADRATADQIAANKIRNALGIPERVNSEIVAQKPEKQIATGDERVLTELKRVFDSMMARAPRQSVRESQKALYDEMRKEGDRAKIAETILNELNREKRTADYPADAGSLQAWEYAMQNQKGIGSKVENDWNYRGIFASKAEGTRTETRGSLNINVTPDVVRELDDLIKRGVFKGNYKFGDPQTGASALSRHDAVTVYFLEKPSEEATKALSDIARRNFRGDNLLGKKISEGFYMSEVGSVSGTHAKELIKKVGDVDDKLGKAIGSFLTDRTGRVAMSEAQFYTTKETLNLYGYDISYDSAKGFALSRFDPDTLKR